MAGTLLCHGAASAQPSRPPASGSAAELNVAEVSATVGREVARRWCAGETPKQAIEQALLEDLSRRNIGAGGLSQATTQALGSEIAVEAFAQAFASCPQTARQVFRSLMQ